MSAVHLTYNLKHPSCPPWSNFVDYLVKDIPDHGLHEALEVCRAKKRGEVHCISGGSRYAAIQILHDTNRSFRFCPKWNSSGEIVPKGKIPVIGAESELSREDAMRLALRMDIDRRRVHPLELGAQWSALLESMGEPGTSQRRKAIQELADDAHMSEWWVRKCVTMWEGIPQDSRDYFLGKTKRPPKGMTWKTIYAIARTVGHDANLTAAAISRIEGKSPEKQRVILKALGRASQRIKPATKTEADRIATRISKEVERQSANPSMQTVKLHEMAFMEVAEVVIDSLACPYGNQRITYVPCPYPSLSADAQQKCKGCGDKGQRLKLTKYRASVKINVPKEMFESDILKLAEEIREEREKAKGGES
jgi:hypothetical protein